MENQVAKMYQHYLKTMQLNEYNMSDVQKQETQRAFYGGCGEMLVAIGKEHEIVESPFFQKKADEISLFFQGEVAKQEFFRKSTVPFWNNEKVQKFNNQK